MTVYRYERPPALVVAEPSRVEVVDLRRWRRVVLENRLARDFLAALDGGGGGPLLDVIRALGEPAHEILFELLRAGRGAPFEAETLAPVAPGMLWLELTQQCNEHCVHCYAESGPRYRRRMDRELALRLIDEAAAMRFEVVQFTGGDPLLCPFLVDLVASATARGIPVREVYTNGLLLKGALLDELTSLGARFALSMYSHDPATHDRITRTPGSQRRTVDAIRRLVERGAHVRVGIALMEENRDDLEPTARLLESIGVPRSRIRHDHIHPVGRGGDVHGAARAADGPPADAPAAPAATASGGLHAGAHRSRGKLMVDPDGVAYPCIFQRWLPLGSLREESLATVYGRRPGPGAVAAEEAFATCCDRIACGDCRVTAYLGTRAAALA